MGNAVTKAKTEAHKAKDEAVQRVNTIIQVLENKREVFLEKVKQTRGDNQAEKTEVGGGRTVMQMSEIRVADSSGPSTQLKNALGEFFECAQGGQKAKKAAVDGAQKLLSAGLDNLFGISQGQGMEKSGFVVFFMNHAFVRVDYFVYTYCAKGEKWGAEASESGACYVADLAVVPSDKLEPSEIDYLLGQSLNVEGVSSEVDEMNVIMDMKIKLCESAILSRMIADKNITFEKLAETTKELYATQNSIEKLFSQLPDYQREEEEPNAGKK